MPGETGAGACTHHQGGRSPGPGVGDDRHRAFGGIVDDGGDDIGDASALGGVGYPGKWSMPPGSTTVSAPPSG